MAEVSPARRAAWDVLSAWLVAGPKRGRLGSEKRPFPPHEIEPRERALAKRLADGAVKRWRALDAILCEIAGGKRPHPEGLHAALLLGAWQCFFAADIPTHAAVAEAVELAKRAAGQGGAGFANAILRKVARRPRFPAWIPRPGRARTASELALHHSYPDALVARWLAEHGAEPTLAMLAQGNAEPQTSLRVNLLRAQPEECAARLEEEGTRTIPGTHPRCLLVVDSEGKRAPPPLSSPCFAEGLFTVQDASAVEVAELCAAEPGMRVLDYCAAPGTKTTAIAETMRDEGSISAHDASAKRLAKLPTELARLGLGSVELVDGAPEGTFDRILVDAPCSNTGVLARRPEARWRFDPETLGELAATQRGILDEAIAFLSRGGRLVYATCSVEPEENEGVAEALAAEPGLRLVSTERCLPEEGLRDGGGVAVFEKEG